MALPERIPYYTTRAQKSHQKQFTAFVSANEEVNANLAGTAYVSHRKQRLQKGRLCEAHCIVQVLA